MRISGMNRVAVCKRFISCLLIVVMLITSISFPSSVVSAEETTDYIDSNNATIDSDTSIESDSGLGDLISNSLENTEDEEEDADIRNKILSVTFGGNVAHVTFNNELPCKIIVAVYDESTQIMYGSGMGEFEPNQVDAEIILNVESMPSYFIIKAFMLDIFDNPLHSSFESIEYTEAHQAFLSTTTSDFKEEDVVNFDNDESNNFAVLKDTTISIVGSEYANTVVSIDDETKTYVFENVDTTLTSLAVGDFFYYTLGDDMRIIGKILNIAIDNTTVTIVGDVDVALDDVFEFVKIEIMPTSTSASVDMSDADEGVEYLGEYEDAMTYGLLGDHDATVSSSHKWVIERELYQIGEGTDDSLSVKISAAVSGKFSVNFKAHIYFDYCSVGFSLTEKINMEVSLSGEVTNKEMNLGEIPFPTGIGDLTIVLDFDLVVESSAEISLSYVEESTVGFEFDTRTGLKNTSVPTKAETDVKFEGKVFIGVKASPKAKCFGGILEAYLSLKAGVEFEASTVIIENTDLVKHACNTCVEGDVSAVFSATIGYTIKAKVAKVDIFDYSDEVTFAEIENKLFDFYCSNAQWGIGTCKNYLHKVTFIAVDTSGKPVEGVKIDDVITDSSGKVSKFCYMGEIEVTAEKENYQQRTICFEVTEPHERTFTIYKDGESRIPAYEYHGSVIDSGICGENVRYTLYDNGLMIFDGFGDMYEYYFDDYNYISDVPYFKNIDNIKQVTINDGITNVGAHIFAEASNLLNVKLPSSIVRIDSGAFAYCINLRNINLPNGLQFIGESAFIRCKSLPNITIPNSVTYIDWHAFFDCTLFSNFVIPEGITVIEKGLFFCCELQSVEIPASVTQIKKDAFYGCNSLKDVYYAGTEDDWKNIDIGESNSCLLSETTTIHYNSTMSCALSVNLENVNIIEEDTFVLPLSGTNNDVCAVSFSAQNLVPNAVYYLVVLKDYNGLIDINCDSLLYIDDVVTDQNGSVEVNYYLENAESMCSAVLLGECNHCIERKKTAAPLRDSNGLYVEMCKKCNEIINFEFIPYMFTEESDFATNYIYNGVLHMQPNIYVEDVLLDTNNVSDVKIVDDSGINLEVSDYIQTGCKIQRLINDCLVDELTVIIKGDTDGDGLVTVADAQASYLHLLNSNVLEGVYYDAAKVSGEKYSILDVMRILNVIVSGDYDDIYHSPYVFDFRSGAIGYESSLDGYKYIDETNNRSCSLSGSADGYLDIDITGGDSSFLLADFGEFNLSEFPIFKISMKNGTTREPFEMFLYDESDGITPNDCIKIKGISTNDSEFVEYIFDLSIDAELYSDNLLDKVVNMIRMDCISFNDTHYTEAFELQIEYFAFFRTMADAIAYE